jgi:hypothetical protein
VPKKVAKKAPKKVVKKTPKKKAAKKSKTAVKPTGRMKIVWAVCDHSLKILKTYPYPARKEAETEAARLQKSKGKEHVVRAEKVPME